MRMRRYVEESRGPEREEVEREEIAVVRRRARL